MEVDLPTTETMTRMNVDTQVTSIHHLGIECLQRVASKLNSQQQLSLLVCGDKCFSVKWAYGFRDLECSSSSWRSLAFDLRLGGKVGRTKTRLEGKADRTKARLEAKAGRTKVSACLFPNLHSLTLDPWSRTNHTPLNKKEIESLPQGLLYLSLALKKNTCDVALPPNLVALDVSNLADDFDPLYPWSSTITELGLRYKKGHTRLPKHLAQMTSLVELTLSHPTAITAEDIQHMPPSLTRLVLFGASGCFKNQAALDAVGRVLVNLESAECHHVFYQPPGIRPVAPRPNLSVFPPTVTHLNKAFMCPAFNSEEWLDYPRQLVAFDEEYITVYGAHPQQWLIKQHLMHNIPPMYRRIHLSGVTWPCPLRFVTHLRLRAAPDSLRLITQQQIEACKDMASVVHLELENALDHESGLIDLSVSSWRLQSLKVGSSATVNEESLYLDDYIPWLTESLTSLHMHCGVLIANLVDKLPSSLQTRHLRVAGDMATTIDKVHPDLLPLIDFAPPEVRNPLY